MKQKISKSIIALLAWSFVGCQTTRNQPAMDEAWLNQRAIVINFLNRGLPSRAMQEMAPLFGQQTDNADFLSLYGLTLLALNDPKPAVEALTRAYDLQPNATTGLNLSSALIEANQPKTALDVLLKIQKSDDGLKGYAYPERLYHNIGLANEKSGRKKTALKAYQKALKVNPNFYLSLVAVAEIYQGLGKNKSSLSHFERARNQCPNCVEPVIAASSLLIKSKQSPKAINLLRQYIARRDVTITDRNKAHNLLLQFESIPNVQR